MAKSNFDAQIATLEAMYLAFDRRDLVALTCLFHPDATLHAITPSDVQPFHGHDGLAGFVNQVRERTVHASFDRIEPVTEDAVLMIGRVQRQGADNALSDSFAAWLVRFEDGLIWRTDTFTDEAEARASAALLSTHR